MTNTKKFSKVLFFTKCERPTAAEAAKMKELGARGRNGAYVEKGASVEKCDAVCGNVPDSYKKLKGVEVIPFKATKASKGASELD